MEIFSPEEQQEVLNVVRRIERCNELGVNIGLNEMRIKGNA